MPTKGIILIAVIAIVIAVYFKDSIYEYLNNDKSNHEENEDDEK